VSKKIDDSKILIPKEYLEAGDDTPLPNRPLTEKEVKKMLGKLFKNDMEVSRKRKAPKRP